MQEDDQWNQVAESGHEAQSYFVDCFDVVADVVTSQRAAEDQLRTADKYHDGNAELVRHEPKSHVLVSRLPLHARSTGIKKMLVAAAMKPAAIAITPLTWCRLSAVSVDSRPCRPRSTWWL